LRRFFGCRCGMVVLELRAPSASSSCALIKLRDIESAV
jgi:hypothetical protein